jgi:hypothetical protein
MLRDVLAGLKLPAEVDGAGRSDAGQSPGAPAERLQRDRREAA